jgi:SnoaL-like protein
VSGVADDSRLIRLVDRGEIEDCLARYFRGIDRFDLDLVRAAYHPDAYDDHGDFRGTADEFVAHLAKLLDQFVVLTHFRGNVLIEFQDADSAHVETYALAFHRKRDDPLEELLCVRYLDRFERRAGEWRVATRRVVVDWSTEIEADPPSERAKQFIQGSHSKRDPVYAW